MEQAPKVEGTSSGTSALSAGLGRHKVHRTAVLRKRAERIARLEKDKQQDAEVMRSLGMPIRVEQMLFGNGMMVLQWIAAEPSVAGYEFLAEYISMRLKVLRPNV